MRLLLEHGGIGKKLASTKNNSGKTALQTGTHSKISDDIINELVEYGGKKSDVLDDCLYDFLKDEDWKGAETFISDTNNCDITASLAYADSSLETPLLMALRLKAPTNLEENPYS